MTLVLIAELLLIATGACAVCACAVAAIVVIAEPDRMPTDNEGDEYDN